MTRRGTCNSAAMALAPHTIAMARAIIRTERPRTAADGHDVETRTGPSQDLEYGQVRIRLDRVADQRAALEGISERREPCLQIPAGIHVARRAERVCDRR